MFDVHNTARNVNEILRLCDDDIFVPIENYPRIKMKNHVKREAFEASDVLNETATEDYLYNASVVICRKTEKTIKFMQDWLTLCMDSKLLSPLTTGIQHAELRHNTQEQAILNGLLARRKADRNREPSCLGLSIHQRALSLKSMTKVPRVAVLYCGQLRNYNNADLLYYNFVNLFNRLNCDVFSFCWKKRGYSLHHGAGVPTDYTEVEEASAQNLDKLFSRAGCHLRAAEFEDFEAWLLQQPQRHREFYYEGMAAGGKRVFATSFPQLYSIEKANLLRKRYEAEHGFEYDIVIRFRPDMCLVEPIPDDTILSLLRTQNPEGCVYHLNPPKISYPNRIYDIFFFGLPKEMDAVCSAWSHIDQLLDDPFDNGLPKVDACRLLYAQALRNNVPVVDISRCIGDIYRDESMDEYFHKILCKFN